MPVIAWLQRRSVELAWLVFAAANVAAMVRWETWETIPFHLIWVSLTLVYGFRVWRTGPTLAALSLVGAITSALITIDIYHDTQEWGELSEVPLMSAMFLAMVWHARRRQQALRAVERLADERASLLQRQERFLNDASHELRTPVTIARGHLEFYQRLGADSPEIGVALDELQRMERIIQRLLVLATVDQPDFVAAVDIDVEQFLEEVFMRWAEVAERAWRLGALPGGSLRVDPEALRNALDALLENAVKYTDVSDSIELCAYTRGSELVIEVADEGCAIPPDALKRIFERFARADAARTRAKGGVGLGLAIVEAIARAHGGRCTVRSSDAGSSFALHLPGFRPERVRSNAPPRTSLAPR